MQELLKWKQEVTQEWASKRLTFLVWATLQQKNWGSPDKETSRKKFLAQGDQASAGFNQGPLSAHCWLEPQNSSKIHKSECTVGPKTHPIRLCGASGIPELYQQTHQALEQPRNLRESKCQGSLVYMLFLGPATQKTVWGGPGSSKRPVCTRPTWDLQPWDASQQGLHNWWAPRQNENVELSGHVTLTVLKQRTFSFPSTVSVLTCYGGFLFVT